MPESVKITDLPELSALQNDDIIVVVDGNETQTSRATLGQVKNLDCGPNTVKETAIASGAVTKTKIGMENANRLLYSTGSLVNGKYLAEESEISSFGRSLVAAPNGTSARALINDSNSFTGQIYAEPGEPSLPSYTFTGQPDTGLYMSPPGWPSLSSFGEPVLAVNRDEGVLSRPQGGSILLPAGAMRALVDFTTTAGSAGSYNNPFTMAYSHGFTNYGAPGYDFQQPSIADTTANRNKLIELEAARGNTVNPASFTNASPEHQNRSNFLICGDNTHLHWNGSSWVALPACSNLWISGYTYTPISTVSYNYFLNTTGIVQSPTYWRVYFGLPMPDTYYAVSVVTSTGAGMAVVEKNTTNLLLYSTMTGTIRVSVAVLR